MADRWNDERAELDRLDRERRYGRYRREEYRGADYGSGDYGDRSFQPQDRGQRGRGPVFGERESGANYGGQRYGAPRYDGGRDAGQGGRFYGDDGRERVYRQEYRPSPAITRGGAYDYTRGSDTDRSRDEHAYRVAYGDHHPDHAGHYEGRDRYERDNRRDEGGREDGRSFWERAGDRFASWFGESEYDDNRYRGEHRGRGPTGYKRADERINDEVHERLTDDPWVDASDISISVSAGEVTLSGTVPERETKHRAERIVENLSGVTHVQNNLRVTRGNILTDPGRGFGDSATANQMSSHPITNEGSDPTLAAAKAGLNRSN